MVAILLRKAPLAAAVEGLFIMTVHDAKGAARRFSHNKAIGNGGLLKLSIRLLNHKGIEPGSCISILFQVRNA
jgi:hypothetical protein